MPVKEDVVRMTDAKQSWILEKIAPETTEVTFINRSNVGGSVTAFISNLGNKDTVYHSLINMREISRDPKFKILGNKLKFRFKPN